MVPILRTPRIFLSDQEGALASDAFAALCDAFGIERWLAGSDRGNLGKGGKHTTTGLAEKHIDLLKLAMLKMHADCIEAGAPATPGEIVAECSMAANIILSYGGASPATAVLGTNPRELVEFDGGAVPRQSSDDYLERSIR